MKFVYTANGAEPKSWDFDPAKLMNVEAEAIERITGWPYGEFVERIGQTSMTAIRALLYVYLKRETPTLKPDQVQFSLSNIDLQLDDDEIQAAIDGLATKAAESELTTVEQTQLTALLAMGVDAGPKAATVEQLDA